MAITPDSQLYVPWSAFEWIMGSFATGLGIFASGLLWLFKRHLADDAMHHAEDNAKFELQESRIREKHLENQKDRAEMELRLSAGQKRIEDLINKLIFRELGEKL